MIVVETLAAVIVEVPVVEVKVVMTVLYESLAYVTLGQLLGIAITSIECLWFEPNW